MSASSVGWHEMAILLSCFMTIPFIAGLVMFVVGLSTKKRGLWIGGLVLLLIPVFLMVLGAALALFAWVSHG